MLSLANVTSVNGTQKVCNHDNREGLETLTSNLDYDNYNHFNTD